MLNNTCSLSIFKIYLVIDVYKILNIFYNQTAKATTTEIFVTELCNFLNLCITFYILLFKTPLNSYFYYFYPNNEQAYILMSSI